MAKFPKIKDMESQFQEAQKIPKGTNIPPKTDPDMSHSKCRNLKTKRKFSKADEKTHTYRGPKIKMIRLNYVSKKKKKGVFKVLIGKYWPARGLCPVKTPLENQGEIKAFPANKNR